MLRLGMREFHASRRRNGAIRCKKLQLAATGCNWFDRFRAQAGAPDGQKESVGRGQGR